MKFKTKFRKKIYSFKLNYNFFSQSLGVLSFTLPYLSNKPSLIIPFFLEALAKLRKQYLESKFKKV